jgi:signal transduction histidine kinase
MSQDPYANDLAAIAKIGVVSNILDVVCRATGMGFSAVARVTEDRWIACAVHDEINFGLAPGGELQIESTICNEIRQSGRLVVIDEVATDAEYREHHTPKQYGFQSYISVPISLPDGRFFGTLCAIDPRPARLNNVQTVETFKLFADLIGRHLDAQERLSLSEAALLSAAQTLELQNQFVAVLGHDLRNPLSAIQAGAKMLSAMGLAERADKIARVIDRSTARMTGLIDNVLDFARTRLGGGITLTVIEDSSVRGMLDQVVSELRTAHPDRVINTDFQLPSPVPCDRGRVGQLFSNLLANALTHGDTSAPVDARARSDAEHFELSVSNRGAAIDPETSQRLFQPFARGTDASHSHGLGLGLYIASEIAHRHGGSIEVTSLSGETKFTFVMPLGQITSTKKAGPR